MVNVLSNPKKRHSADPPVWPTLLRHRLCLRSFSHLHTPSEGHWELFHLSWSSVLQHVYLTSFRIQTSMDLNFQWWSVILHLDVLQTKPNNEFALTTVCTLLKHLKLVSYNCLLFHVVLKRYFCQFSLFDMYVHKGLCITFRLGWQEFFTVEEAALLSRVPLPLPVLSIFVMAASYCILPELLFLFNSLWEFSLTLAGRYLNHYYCF